MNDFLKLMSYEGTFDILLFIVCAASQVIYRVRDIFPSLAGKNIEKLKEKYSKNSAYYIKHFKVFAVICIIFELIFLSFAIFSLVCNCLYNSDNLFSTKNITLMLIIILLSIVPFALDAILGFCLNKKNKNKIKSKDNVDEDK